MLGVIAMYSISVFGILAVIVVAAVIVFAAAASIRSISRSEDLTQLFKALVLGGLGFLAVCMLVGFFYLRLSYSPPKPATPHTQFQKVEGHKERVAMHSDALSDAESVPRSGTGVPRFSSETADTNVAVEPLRTDETAEPPPSEPEELREVTRRADLPEWVGDDHYVDDVHYVSVSSFPKVDWHEARADAWDAAQEQIVEDFHSHYPEASDWKPRPGLVPRESVVIDEFGETREMTMTGSFSSPMHVFHFRLKLTPETREIVHDAYREQVVQARLKHVGFGLGALTLLTGTLALLLRRGGQSSAAAA